MVVDHGLTPNEAKRVRPPPQGASRSPRCRRYPSNARRRRRESWFSSRHFRGLETDAQEVPVRLGAAEKRDARVGRVEPQDGHLGDRIAEPAREDERLHVEGEAVDPGAAEDRPCGLPREELEAALRVADARQEKQARDPDEALAHGSSPERLALLHELLVHGARADRDGGVRRRELLPLVDGRRKVRVRHEDEAARGLEAAGADREALAAILREAEDAEVEAVAAPRGRRAAAPPR